MEFVEFVEVIKVFKVVFVFVFVFLFVFVFVFVFVLFYLMVLGVGSNLILFCLLKAFYLVKVSSVAPFRYLELLISIALGYLVFSELPPIHTYIGALIIIPSSLYIVLQGQKSEAKAEEV